MDHATKQTLVHQAEAGARKLARQMAAHVSELRGDRPLAVEDAHRKALGRKAERVHGCAEQLIQQLSEAETTDDRHE